MNLNNYLDFEKPITELEEKIESLKSIKCKDKFFDFSLKKEVLRLKNKNKELTKKIFSNLKAWQIVQLSRHNLRPYTMDYIERVFNDFDELYGDRKYSDDKAIIGGIARLNNRPVMIIGHQKGRSIKEKIFRNFGMPAPEGYRKALRLMKLAEKFQIPIITMIDTPGAYPGLGAEERGQAESIARNLKEISHLKTSIICNIIGEGGSGGALAIGIGDRINMLQYSTYSVISPEGCASILWKNVKKANIAAENMGITAESLKKLKMIDTIIPEPLGAAHRNFEQAAYFLKQQLLIDLSNLDKINCKELVDKRYKKLISYGYI